MTSALFLVALALVTAILSFAVVLRWWMRAVPVDWSAFAAMGLGSIGIAIFNLVAAHSYLTDGVTLDDGSMIDFVLYSRIIRFFILLSTSLMAIFALLRQREE